MADERGEKVPRAAVVASVQRGQSIATGVVWAAALVAAASCWVLLSSDGHGPGHWIAPATGGLGGAVFGLRSRMFSRARQVGPMLGVAVVAAVAAAVTTPDWLSSTSGSAGPVTLALLAVIAAVLAAAGFGALADVPKARMRRLWERLEALAVLAVIPALVLLFDVIGAVKRWIG